MGSYSESISYYERALLLNPASPYILSNLGNALRQVGDLDRSIELTRKAMLMDPDAATIHSNYLFSIQYSSRLSAQQKHRAHLEYAVKFEDPLRGHWGGYEIDRTSARRLRLGYVSGDFRDHSLVFFIEPVIKNHDRSKFEVFCYSAHPVHDAVSERIKSLADHWIPCASLSDDALAARIRADRIDVLIDLSGHTGYNRLLTFARKPAPVQMTWLGYQSTTGLGAVDYRITDEGLDPSGATESFHSEQLLRLRSSGTFSPAPNAPDVNPLPALHGSLFTYGCLNNPSKITDEVVSLWAAILTKVPQSRLMVGNATVDLEDRLSALFAAHGVDTTRLLFKPKVTLQSYLELHHEVDLALDTFPYNGGTTTFHSLSMGVPVIALEGKQALAKVGTSVMRSLGLDDFCALTPDDYVAKAVYFSTQLKELGIIRDSLRQRVSVLAEEQAICVTRDLEQAVWGAWSEFCRKSFP